MPYLKFFLVLVCCGMISCTATKPLTSHVSPGEVTGLKLLEPFAYMEMIEKGNKARLNDSISDISKQLNMQVLKSMNDQIPISGDIILKDPEINKSLEQEYEYLMVSAERDKSISNLKITPTLDKILEANDTRFGLIIVSSGFTRVKGNYAKQILKGGALGILTLGMYYQAPVKAYSTLYAMIVDSKDDNIAFFRKSFLPDREPLDPTVLTKQYKKIFDGYFLSKN